MQLASIDELNKSFFTLNSLLRLYDNRAFETILKIRSLYIRVFMAVTISKLDNSKGE